MLALYTSALVTFFLVIDPPGCAPIFAGLTRGTTPAHRRTMAIRSVLVGTGILLFFALLGEQLLDALGISLDAFRIAGGAMLALIALEMVFERRTARRETRAQEVEASAQEDISVFPMAIPMLAGPGSIAAVMLATSAADGVEETAVVLGALASVMVLALLALLAAGPLLNFLGHRVEAMLTRLLGVLLAALAAQFFIDGIKGAFRI